HSRSKSSGVRSTDEAMACADTLALPMNKAAAPRRPEITTTLTRPMYIARLPIWLVRFKNAIDIAGLLLGKEAIDNFLKSRSLVNWSADIVADDWFKGITPQQIVQRAMQRLEAKGRGILLLHDIHPATAMALPALLKELKERAYRVVHVIPATAM